MPRDDDVQVVPFSGITRNSLPPDPWWPRRVEVEHDGGCVPFHVWLLWHWQFFLPDTECVH